MHDIIDKNTVYVPCDVLKSLERDIFVGMGVPPEDAEICADVLNSADLRGIDSHGIGRLYMYYVRLKRGQQLPVTELKVIKDKGAVARFDAGNGMGQVAAYRAMKTAIDKAKRFGIGMTVVQNSNHYGIAAYYSLMAADRGCIGINGTNARPAIAPTWGTEPMIGTNPLTVAVPTDLEFHWCADHAVSITQRGKIELYARLGKPLEKGWVIDEKGESPTDSREVLNALLKKKAALTPLGGPGESMGGYKGYNYAMLVEILSAGLNTANFLSACIGFVEKDGKKEFYPFNLGHFFIAINIEHFIEPDVFKKRVGDMLRALKASRLQPGAEKIYVAGEKEWEIEKVRRKKGVPLPGPTQLQILEMLNELGIDSDRYGIGWKVRYNPSEVDSQGW